MPETNLDFRRTALYREAVTHIPAHGRKVTHIIGAMKYSDGFGDWQTVEALGAGGTFGVDSITHTAEHIEVDYNLLNVGANPELVATHVQGSDDMAWSGIMLGVQSHGDRSRIYLSRPGVTDKLTWDGPGNDDWTSTNGYFDTFSWDAVNGLQCEVVSTKVIVPPVRPDGMMLVTGAGYSVMYDGANDTTVDVYSPSLGLPNNGEDIQLYIPGYSVVMSPADDFGNVDSTIYFIALVESDI